MQYVFLYFRMASDGDCIARCFIWIRFWSMPNIFDGSSRGMACNGDPPHGLQNLSKIDNPTTFAVGKSNWAAVPLRLRVSDGRLCDAKVFILIMF